jgi:anti-sigma regulatory factor (Ser/Thr protein kinase)
MELSEFSVTAHLEYIPQSIDSFISLCEGFVACITKDSSTRFFLKNAVDEFTVNAIVHGYNKSPGTVTVNVQRFDDHIFLEISDHGIGIDLAKVHLDREARTIDDLSSGGWALSILNRISGGINIAPNSPTGSVISLNIPVPLKI